MQQLMERAVETARDAGEFGPILYTLEAAIEVSGHTRSRLYELIGAHTLEAVKAGRRTLIVGKSLRTYLAALPRAEIRMGRKAA